MKTILALIAILLVILTSKSVESSSIPAFMIKASKKFDVDIALLYAICEVESKCKLNVVNRNDGTSSQKASGIVSSSHGLFQIKLATAKSLGFITKEVKIIKGKRVVIDHTKELLNPSTNAMYAAKLLRYEYDRYHNIIKAISAYNAGRYITGNKNYVNKVLKAYIRNKIEKRF